MAFCVGPCEGFVKAHMIATRKAAHGLFVTIVQYERYKNQPACEHNNESLMSAATRAAKPPHYKQELKKEKN
jgi:hypothetical protein